jgi:hypothetical protein
VPKTMKTLACQEAVALTSDLNGRRIRVASDCKTVLVSLEEVTMGIYTHIV